MKVRALLLLPLFLSLLERGTGNDFDVFCDLVGASSDNSWCQNCSNPCGKCGVACVNERITFINASYKKLVGIPKSIGNLTALKALQLRKCTWNGNVADTLITII